MSVQFHLPCWPRSEHLKFESEVYSRMLATASRQHGLQPKLPGHRPASGGFPGQNLGASNKLQPRPRTPPHLCVFSLARHFLDVDEWASRLVGLKPRTSSSARLTKTTRVTPWQAVILNNCSSRLLTMASVIELYRSSYLRFYCTALATLRPFGLIDYDND